MGKPTGFIEFERVLPACEDAQKRIKHYSEFVEKPSFELLNNQAARCMDCGIPFCHSGCPLGNVIPEFNDAVYKEQWQEAFNILNTTNNFPEFTGRICPAPCESACVLGINQQPVAIEFIEKMVIEKTFELNLIRPNVPKQRTGKKVAVVGSGPAGLAVAAQLNQAGHWVTVFERAASVGGLLRFGIPDFKLDKKVVQRRIDLMQQEGIVFKCNAHVGVNILIENLERDFDVVVLAIGSTIPRDVTVKGRELTGIHFAMEFLSQQNSRNAGAVENKNHRGEVIPEISAKGKNVLVIGGGDTGSDCVGTSNRQGSLSITQIEVLEKPPAERSAQTPWPQWPYMLRNSSSHEEGVQRDWALSIQEFLGDGQGKLTSVRLKRMGWKNDASGKSIWAEIDDSDFNIPCDIALIAAGFLHPQQTGIVEQLALEIDNRGNIKTNENYQSSKEHIFVAGDCRRGQSLVVWAISEGRECAFYVDTYLMGNSLLERKDKSLQAAV